MSHTPGPWTYDAETDTIRSQAFAQSNLMGDYRGVIVCDLEAAHGGKFRRASVAGLAAEVEANARLMAAATQMLDALRATVDYLRELPAEVEDAIKAAIAKATGGAK